jgi:hypothetical protein
MKTNTNLHVQNKHKSNYRNITIVCKNGLLLALYYRDINTRSTSLTISKMQEILASAKKREQNQYSWRQI